MTERRRRVAVVGSGVSGLTAAYVLRHVYDVAMFEADSRLGGHAHTHDVPSASGRIQRVDSGFIVHNARTYPLLLRLFRELGVATQESEMSMSVRCDGCGLEYAGARKIRGLAARPGHLARPRYLRMLAEVPVFHRRARRLMAGEAAEDITLGQFLADGGFSAYFVSHFMTPLVSAVWSCAPRTALRHPARHLFRFLEHHGLLGIGGSPQWRTVTGGSRSYVERIGERLDTVHTSTPVRAVHRHADGVDIRTRDGTSHAYDALVLATHPDQALDLLADPTPAEREVLGAIPYSRNPTVLHTDPSLLPRSPAARASWNYLMPSCDTPAAQVRVSYHLNRLQRLDAPEEYVVTLGTDERIDREAVLARMVYEHPVYTPESLAAQRRLPELSAGRTAYAGAYHGWGFHEDGCRSGVQAARMLGVEW